MNIWTMSVIVNRERTLIIFKKYIKHDLRPSTARVNKATKRILSEAQFWHDDITKKQMWLKSVSQKIKRNSLFLLQLYQGLQNSLLCARRYFQVQYCVFAGWYIARVNLDIPQEKQKCCNRLWTRKAIC